jgi:Xaa-Pro aminopeptidase
VICSPACRAISPPRNGRERRKLADARPAFEHSEYADRLDRLRRAMSEAGVDVVLLSRPESMCWLHGYTARWYRHAGPPEWPALATSVVRADRDEVIHFDFGGEEELLAATSVCRDVRIYPGEAADAAVAFLIRGLTAAGWLDGLAGRGVPSDQHTGEAIEAAINAAGCQVADATALIGRLLHLKSRAEVERIEAAGRVLDIGLQAAVDVIAPGLTELEVWGEMMRATARAGGRLAALHELVASGRCSCRTPSPAGGRCAATISCTSARAAWWTATTRTPPGRCGSAIPRTRWPSCTAAPRQGSAPSATRRGRGGRSTAPGRR